MNERPIITVDRPKAAMPLTTTSRRSADGEALRPDDGKNGTFGPNGTRVLAIVSTSAPAQCGTLRLIGSTVLYSNDLGQTIRANGGGGYLPYRLIDSYFSASRCLVCDTPVCGGGVSLRRRNS